MPDTTYLYLIPFLPLAGFACLGLFGRRFPGQTSGWLATACIAVSAAMALSTAFGYFSDWGREGGGYASLQPIDVPWLVFTEELAIHLGVLLDPISVMMICIVTFVSLMVHVYSLGYLKGADRLPTYFAFLGLFTFSMLGLVMSSNLFQMYICWELVGVSSFLLIGFYFSSPAAVAASKKAFIVTRFADLGFLIGILILGEGADSYDFLTIIERLTATMDPNYAAVMAPTFLGFSVIGWGLGLVFIGGMGKSAMFPLHIWLPDAMEGPTPVSALIHAATMVVAGVFLVARLFPVYAVSVPELLSWVTLIGVFSALFAAVIACTQTDIKRVLAYSTMSQIGFMMFALGVSGYGGEAGLGYMASQFHLFTHALFKALLFLCAGAVIHAVHSNELKDMGGLRHRLPVTHACFLIACLAIAGLPPLAGFFSKEEILLAAYQRNHTVFYLALATSGLTAFYMFRLYFNIFWGQGGATGHHGHGEGGGFMMVPLVILSMGAIGAGFVPFGQFVTSDRLPLETHLHLGFSIAPVALGLAGIGLAALLYRKPSPLPGQIASRLGAVYETVYDRFYVDELYQFVTKQVVFRCIGAPAAWVDRHVVNGLVDFTGNTALKLSETVKGLQSGRVQQYALVFLCGLLLLGLLLMYIF
ncbi:MAG: NADH-quinone oxidoreductase subunit L [Bacteroidetes bacterium]|nr:NADH-quinone oxidoreductase subunit L [Bacteroidota bacterium]